MLSFFEKVNHMQHEKFFNGTCILYGMVYCTVYCLKLEPNNVFFVFILHVLYLDA